MQLLKSKELQVGLAFAAIFTPVFFIDLFSVPMGMAGGEFYTRILFAIAFNAIISFFVPFALLCLPKTLRVPIFWCMCLICIVFTSLSIFHMLTYGQLIASPSVTALLDTNFKEAKEYLAFQSSISTITSTILAIVLMSLFSIFLWKLFNAISKKVHWKFNFLALLIVLTLGYFGWNRLTFAYDNPISFIFKVGNEVISERGEFETMKSLKTTSSNAKMLAAADSTTHIVIIGESATPSHMSLYGYSRETNPTMKKQRALSQLIGQDVCSSQPNTKLSLSDIMLAGKPLVVNKDGYTTPNLLSILKDAGYSTFWISNQPTGAGYFSGSSSWSIFSDYTEFVNKRDFRIGYDFDERLIPSIKKALENSEKHKIIFIHIMGSHPDYKQRYPKSFNIWNENAEVPDSVKRKNDPDFQKNTYNAYDNSILYTDFIVSSILDLAIAKNVASVTYFSDHGQNLGENTAFIGHSMLDGPRQGYEIPLIFWINDAELARLKLDSNQLKSNLKQPFSVDKIQYTLFDLFGVSQVEKNNESLFSNGYAPSKRKCDGMH